MLGRKFLPIHRRRYPEPGFERFGHACGTAKAQRSGNFSGALFSCQQAIRRMVETSAQEITIRMQASGVLKVLRELVRIEFIFAASIGTQKHLRLC